MFKKYVFSFMALALVGGFSTPAFANAAATITNVSPVSGTQGSAITITGSGFASLNLPTGSDQYGDGVWLTNGSYSMGMNVAVQNDNIMTATLPIGLCPGTEPPSCSSNFETQNVPAGGYSIYIKSNNGQNVSNKFTFAVVTLVSPAPTGGGEYVNNTYNFEMYLDGTWNGYQVITNTTGNGMTIEFSMPYTDPHYGNGPGNVIALYISVYTEGQWASEQAQEGPKPQLLKDTGTTVYAYSTWQDSPSDLQNLNIQGATNSFAVTNPTSTGQSVSGSPTPSTPMPTPTTGSGINLPDGTVIKLPGSPTVYLVSGGQLKPFTSAQDFLGQGYSWSQIQQVSPSQVPSVPVTGTNSGSGTSSFYPYPSGSIVNDNGTVYFISGSTKVPFTNYNAFVGLGYSLRNVVQGDLTNYTLGSHMITTANVAHPWGSWLIYQGTVYYSTQNGMIGVPSAQIFTSNGGSWNLLVKTNSYDIAALNANSNLPPLTLSDSRIYSAK